MVPTHKMDALELQAQLKKCHGASYGWALNCCGRDPDTAEEVLQNVYLKVLQGKARYQGAASFQTWLFAVIRKTSAEERRRKWLRQFRLLQYEARAERSVAEATPDENLDHSQMRTLFQQALAVLPRRQREVLLLVFYHDLSVFEAAIVMGVSIGSARTHYERAKKALRQWLAESKIFDETELQRRTIQAVVP